MRPPEINNSTKEERAKYISDNYYCRSNCEICGQCSIFHGQSAESVYAEYIAGLRSFEDITKDLRR